MFVASLFRGAAVFSACLRDVSRDVSAGHLLAVYGLDLYGLMHSPRFPPGIPPSPACLSVCL